MSDRQEESGLIFCHTHILMSEQKLRVVLVGCGGISHAWMSTKAMREGVDLVGVVDVRSDAIARFIEKWELGESVEGGCDLASMLQKVNPDAVFDLTVPAAHCDVTCTALNHGCHVLGEKPMATSMEEGRLMVEAAVRNNRIYAVTQTRRYKFNLQKLGSFLQSGAIGPVHTVHADFFIGANFGGFREQMAHVLLLDMAVHSFDQGRFLTPGYPVRVCAEDWNPQGSWYAHGASAWAAFTTSTGARFTYRGNWAATGKQTRAC